MRHEENNNTSNHGPYTGNKAISKKHPCGSPDTEFTDKELS